MRTLSGHLISIRMTCPECEVFRLAVWYERDTRLCFVCGAAGVSQ